MATFSAKCKEVLANLLDQVHDNRNTLPKEDLAIVIAKTAKEMQQVPGLGKKIGSVFTNFLISGVGTHLANVASVARLFGEIPAKYVSGGMYDLFRAVAPQRWADKVADAPGLAEATGYAKGVGRAMGLGQTGDYSFPKAMSEFWYFVQRGFMTGQSSDAPTEYATRTIGAGRINRAGEYVESPEWEKKLGTVVELPSRGAVAIDEGMKAFYRRVKMYEVIEQITHRWTPKQFEDLGVTKESVLSTITNALESGDKEWMRRIKDLSPDIAKIATDFAKIQTFQEAPPIFIKNIMKYKDKHPWATFFAPFIRTPWNIASQAMDYVPALGVAKHMTHKDEFGHTRLNAPDLNNVDKNILGKQMLGISTAWGMFTLADAGLITAGYSDDPAERQKQKDAGIPQYGLKVGDTWLDWSRVEPFATYAIFLLETRRKMIEYNNQYKKDGMTPDLKQKIGDMGTATAVGLSKAVVNRQFLFGMSTGLNAMLAPDDKLNTFAKQFFGGITVPAIVGSVAKAIDPYQRKTDNVLEAIQSRIPFARESLPIDYGTAGEPNRNPQAGIAAAVPFIHTEPQPTELQQFLGSLPSFQKGPVGKSLNGVKLDSKQAELLDRLSSEEVGKLMEKVYRRIRDNPKMGEPMKAKLMEDLTNKGRDIAQKKVFAQLMKDPEFKQKYLRHQRVKAGLE